MTRLRHPVLVLLSAIAALLILNTEIVAPVKPVRRQHRIRFKIQLVPRAVSYHRNGSMAEITVIDTGDGITREFLPFVFDRFKQGDSSISRKHAGLGLGLAIARHLTELHSGTIEAASEGEGLGAAFKVSLPLSDVSKREVL